MTSGGFDRENTFHSLTSFPEQEMTLIFREKVFKMMIGAHFLSEDFAQKMRTWTWSGFSVHQSWPVSPGDDPGKNRLASYISRAPFLLKKVEYDPHKGIVTFHPKKEKKTYDPIEFIFLLQKHIPNKGEVLIRYYSNVARGKRTLASDEADPKKSTPISVDDECPDQRALKKRWAQLFKKVYEVDPLECPRCGSQMRIISFIDQWDTILRILKHLELYPSTARAPPANKSPLSKIPPIQETLFPLEDFFGS